MQVFKFTPDFMGAEQIEAITVGRKGLLSHSAEKIRNAARDGRTINMIFVGPRGIGKSHTALRLAHELSGGGGMTLAQLSEEEYSVSSLDGFFSRVLDALGERVPDAAQRGPDVAERARSVFQEYRERGRPVVILAENLQTLFSEMEGDLPTLRSIILEDQSFFIIGTALSTFDQITSPDAAFYNFFEINRLRGLDAGEIAELVNLRLKGSGEAPRGSGVNPAGLRILTGGNPRLIHTLCDIMAQKKSGHDLEKDLMGMLDRLTPFYQARMEAMPPEKRRVFEALALSDGPSTPTEIAGRMGYKNTTVTAHLARLRNEGIVERVRLRRKKETRYQVSDRLYRVWREFRTRGGRAKTIAFVRFLELWYSREGLAREYDKESDALESMPQRDADRARPVLYAMRCILNAMPDGSDLLEDVVDKFAAAGDYRGAESTIKEFRDKKKSEPGGLLSVYSEIVAKNAELRLIPDGRREDHIGLIRKDIAEADRAIGDSENAPGLETVHAVSRLVKYAMDVDLDLAASVNGRALARITECEQCRCFTHDRISIMAARNDRAGALKAADAALDARQNLGLVALRTRIRAHAEWEQLVDDAGTARVRSDAGAGNPAEYAQLVDDMGTMVQAAGFPDKLPACLRRSMALDMYGLLSETASLIKAMEKEERDDMVECFLAGMVIALHEYAPEGANLQGLEEYIKPLKPFITSEIVSGIPLSFIMEHGSAERVGRTLDVLFKALDGDQLGALPVLKRAVDYVLSKDADSLERLHPEQRELALEMISKMSPGTAIPEEVLDSVGSRRRP